VQLLRLPVVVLQSTTFLPVRTLQLLQSIAYFLNRASRFAFCFSSSRACVSLSSSASRSWVIAWWISLSSWTEASAVSASSLSGRIRVLLCPPELFRMISLLNRCFHTLFGFSYLGIGMAFDIV
jgi:hypothetical protein